jgi:hypothetical protein
MVLSETINPDFFADTRSNPNAKNVKATLNPLHLSSTFERSIAFIVGLFYPLPFSLQLLVIFLSEAFVLLPPPLLNYLKKFPTLFFVFFHTLVRKQGCCWGVPWIFHLIDHIVSEVYLRCYL